MEPDQEARLARIVARHAPAAASGFDDPDDVRRRARNRVLAELPRLVARIADIVAEINDVLSGTGITLSVVASEHSPASEAVFTVQVSSAPEREPTLRLNVDFAGCVTALIERDSDRATALTSNVFDLDKPHLGDLMLVLLETAFPEA
jgi:hypothetical protein